MQVSQILQLREYLTSISWFRGLSAFTEALRESSVVVVFEQPPDREIHRVQCTFVVAGPSSQIWAVFGVANGSASVKRVCGVLMMLRWKKWWS